MILEALEKLSIVKVVVSYSGSGDSGQVEDATAFDKDDAPIVMDDVVVDVTADKSVFKEGVGFEHVVGVVSTPLKEALEEMAYDALEMKHPGWENNDGASGELVVIVSDKSFTLGHDSYYTTSDHTESKL